MIAQELVHVQAVQVALLDIERRRLSTPDMYRYALSTMGGHLDALIVDLRESRSRDEVGIGARLQTLLDNTFAAMQDVRERTVSRTINVSTVDIDVALMAYATLRDGIQWMYRNHHGTWHDRSCTVCMCLWRCAGMIGAVEQINKGKMAVARQQVQTLHRGELSHRAGVVPRQKGDVTVFEASCPTCGVLATYPLNRFGDAAAVVTKHRRAATALLRHFKPTV